MARFVHFYRMSPATFWALDLLEYRALCTYMDDYYQAQRDAADKARSRPMRRR